jgi:hypothetical protein
MCPEAGRVGLLQADPSMTAVLVFLEVLLSPWLRDADLLALSGWKQQLLFGPSLRGVCRLPLALDGTAVAWAECEKPANFGRYAPTGG